VVEEDEGRDRITLYTFLETKNDVEGKTIGLERKSSNNECKIAKQYGWAKACGIGVEVYRCLPAWLRGL
jgi:hypothetical protein